MNNIKAKLRYLLVPITLILLMPGFSVEVQLNSRLKPNIIEAKHAENDVEYAELSMVHDMQLQPPSGRVSSHRAWDPSSEPLDEHVMLFHLFELQDRNNTSSTNLQSPGNCPWTAVPYKNASTTINKEPKKSRTKTFMEPVDFNIGTAMASISTADEINPLDLPSTSSAPALRSTAATAAVNPKIMSTCMRKALSGKYPPREHTYLGNSRTAANESVNKWIEQTIPLPSNSQGDLCPLETLFRSINFDADAMEKTGSIFRKGVNLPVIGKNRTPSPPRAVPAPVPEPSRDGSSAFSWTPSLLSNRKHCKTSETTTNTTEHDKKKNDRSPDRPKSS